MIDLSGDSVSGDLVQQYYATCDHEKKFGLLVKLLIAERPHQAIVFTRTKREADELYRRSKAGCLKSLPSTATCSRPRRDRVMKRFRGGELRLLIATDVVGRGIDVSGISHIINYDVPESCDDYVHRVGRTGRISSERAGRAFTFVTKEEGEELTRIEMRINKMLDEWRPPDAAFFTPRRTRYVEAEPPAPVRNDEDFADFFVA